MLHTDFAIEHGKLHRHRNFWGAVLGGVATGLGALFGSSKQASATKSAQAMQAEAMQRTLDFQKLIYDAGAPARDLSQRANELAFERLQEDPQSFSSIFDLASKEGAARLAGNAEATGVKGSDFSKGLGRFEEGLVGQQAQLLANQRGQTTQGLLGLGGNLSQGIGAASNLLGQANQIGTNMASLQQSQGQIQGNLLSNIGNTIGNTLTQLPLLSRPNVQGVTQGAGVIGGQSQTPGLSTYQPQLGSSLFR